MERKIPIKPIIFALALFALVGYLAHARVEKMRSEQIFLPDTAKITVGSETFTARLADTPAERTEGLSGTEEVPEDGMLFIFDKDDIEGFWMKDMKYPIDIIWINSARTVIDINDHVLPETYPYTFYPPQPIRYVLEVRDGFAQEKGIKIGDTIDIQK